MDRFDNLQLPYEKPGMFQNYRALGRFAVKVTVIGVSIGALMALVANGCTMHRHDYDGMVKQEPGIIMEFKPVTVQPMPNVIPAYDLDAQQEYSI